MRDYFPNTRIHDPAYLVRHIEELKQIAIKYKNSSSLIYACLDLRTALELIEFKLLLESAGEELRPEIAELCKNKNGIDRANKRLKTLKAKFQLFYQAVCETLNIQGKYFDFKKSDDLQFQLSKYLHTFTRTQSEINYDSNFMQAALLLIDQTITFIKDLLIIEGEYTTMNIEKNSIPPEDKILFEKWKDSVKMTYVELKSRLKENLDKRKTKK